MGGILSFKKIKSQMILWIFTAVLLPVIIVCTTIYYQRVTAIKTEAYSKLTAIRDLKVSQLNSWLAERKRDFDYISKDIEIRNLSTVFTHKKKTKKDQKIILSAENFLDSFKKEYHAYHEVFIIDIATGIVQISTNKASQGLDASQEPYFIEPLKTGSFYIRDIYYSTQLKRPAMCFAIPITSLDLDGKKQFAIMVARIDLENSLYDLLLQRTGMGKTGETLIVNKDLMALNDLRWYKNAPLKLKIDAKPARLASQGNVGVIEALDYRGINVLASYTYLPETRWGFVAKQDLSEIYAPIKKMLVNIIIILLISGLFAYVLAHMLAINFSKPIMEFTKIARKIQAGDLSARSIITYDNEYSILSRTFNGMAESIEAHTKVQKALRTLDKILVTSTTINDFGKKFVEKIIEYTGSAFGSFYLFSPDKKAFEHIFSMGFDMKRLESLNENIIKDAFNKAFTTQKITYIHEISKDTVFTINTIAGTALPRGMVTIPLVIKEQVIGVIAMGTLANYSETAVGILEQIQSGAGTALSNMISAEKTATMAHKLQSNNVELEAQARQLQAVTKNLKQQNTKLDTQSRQLKEVNRLKSEFLSNMSHELRTPLNSIMALSSVLKMNSAQKLTTEEVQYLDVIKRNGKRLLDLINDILDLSKIEAGHMEITLSFFSIKTTIEDLMDSLRLLAREKNLTLRMEFAPDLPKIQSDEKRVHQILLNLISNAVKFTDKGEIAVLADFNDDKICLRIIDTGIGIARKDLPLIFEEFKQVDGSTSRSYEGTGLGLAIAYKATINLGGELSVESKIGGGTTFTLHLPVTWQGQPQPIKPSDTTQPPEMIENRKTILVVDDEPESVDIICDLLCLEGYNTLKATSGTQALALAKTHQPFAVTLDLSMPEMDGLETLQRLKKHPETSDIPVIIVSVSDDKTGLALGAVGHVTKPVISDVLIKEIKKTCVQAFSIMVADDNEFDRKHIIQIITQEKMEAIPVENGKQCIKMIKKKMPDVLVLDLMMPELDGFGVLKTLRSDTLTMSLPVIMVTAKDLTPEEKKRLNQYVVSVLYKNNLTSKKLVEKIKDHLRGLEKPLIPETTQKKQKKKRVLVVEDNKAAIIQIKMILEQEGYHVDIARGGKKAEEFVQDIIPDGIILDLMMPDIDGFDVLDNIRNTKKTANIPVLILTAKNLTPDDLKKLSANNIQQLVQKGNVEREDLLLKVKIMLGEKPKTSSLPVEHTQKTKKAGIKHPKKIPEIARLDKALPTILVIEDNPDNLLTIKAVLKNKYTIMEASDGEKGLAAALQSLPDLILLDISLPGMDGYVITKKIKADERAGRIPVIALTAHAMKGDRDKIISAGCNDYISKPIDPKTVLEVIKKWLEEKL
ncbi:MAG: response regulator [Desulfobacteraceae bacterium]|nr:response regulator [Desulfobacteraceae bacterium]